MMDVKKCILRKIHSSCRMICEYEAEALKFVNVYGGTVSTVEIQCDNTGKNGIRRRFWDPVIDYRNFDMETHSEVPSAEVDYASTKPRNSLTVRRKRLH